MHIRALRYRLLRTWTATWASLLLLALVPLSSGGCDNGATMILNLDPVSVPTTVTQYLLRTTLNGEAGSEQIFDLSQRRIALQLPPGLVGTVEITVLGVDAGGCRISLGAVRAEVPTNLNRSSEGRLPLMASGSTQCWQAVTTGSMKPFTAVHGSDAQNVYAVGGGGSVLRCKKGSSTCTTLNAATTANLNAVWAADANTALIVGAGGYIGVCSADSDTCKPLVSAVSDDLNSVWGSSASNIYAVGMNGRVVRCSVPAMTCTPVATGVGSVNLYKVYGIDALNIYVAGANGTVLRCAQGSPCSPLSTGVTDSLYAVGVSDGMGAYIGGNGGTILLCPNGQIFCQNRSGISIQKINAIVGTDAAHVYMVGNVGTITRCTSGAGCEFLAPPIMGPLNAVWGLEPSSGGTYVIGSGGYIGRCTNSATTCAAQNSPSKESLNAIWGTDANNIYIAGDNGTLLRHYP